MADNHHRHDEPEPRVVPQEELVNPTVHHEQVDVNVLAISKFGIGFVLALIAVVFIVWGVFAYLKSVEEAAGGPLKPRYAVGDARRLPPEPRLQAAPQLDLREMRAAEDQILNSYAWLDQERGLVRIPIDRAIDVLAQRGLPSRAQAGSRSTTNVAMGTPSESGLGPAIQQVGGPLAPLIHVPPVQPQLIRGDGNMADGRQAGGPPTPLENSPGVWGPSPSAATAGNAAAPAPGGGNRQRGRGEQGQQR